MSGIEANMPFVDGDRLSVQGHLALLNLAGPRAISEVTGLQAALDGKRAANVIFCRQAASRTLTSTTAAQKIFDQTTNGAVTLATGVYRFRCFLHLTGMSATSGNGALDFAGTATVGWVNYASAGLDSDTPLSAGTRTGALSVTTSGAAAAADTGTGLAVVIEGVLDVTAAGTLIPSFALTTAAAATVQAGTNIWFERIGNTGVSATAEWG